MVLPGGAKTHVRWQEREEVTWPIALLRFPTQCPVLTERMVLPDCTGYGQLEVAHTLWLSCGTERGYAVCGTEQDYARELCQRVRGTDIGYAATRLAELSTQIEAIRDSLCCAIRSTDIAHVLRCQPTPLPPTRYGLSSTDFAYAATRRLAVRSPYARTAPYDPTRSLRAVRY
eukprot:3941962-Rhodomonas_salina.2